jgi:hypothetical protein
MRGKGNCAAWWQSSNRDFPFVWYDTQFSSGIGFYPSFSLSLYLSGAIVKNTRIGACRPQRYIPCP